MTRALSYVFAACLGVAVACAVPQPVPPPQPIPGDAFTNRVFDCRALVVAVERDSAKPDVRACLLGQAPGSCPAEVGACLACEAGQYASATVACLARDLGADCNASVLAGSVDPGDKACADAARKQITTWNVGYR